MTMTKSKPVVQEVTFKNTDLRKALNQVYGVCSERTTLPITNFMCLKMDNGEATLSATDLEKAITVKVKVEGTDNFGVLLPKRATSKFFSTKDNETAIVRDTGIKNGTTSTWKEIERFGVGKIRIGSPSINDWVPIPQPDDKLVWHTLDAGFLCKMFAIVVRACATEESRPVLTGLVCHDGAIAAADGFQLAVAESDKFAFGLGEREKDNHSSKGEVLIPGSTITMVCRLFKGLNELEFAYNADKHQVWFRSEDITFVSQTVEGTFPQYQQLIPKEFTSRLTFSSPVMADRLKLVDLGSIQSGIMKIRVGQDKEGNEICSIDAGNIEDTEYALKVPGIGTGDETKIAFNNRYFFNAISPFSVCHMDTTNPSSPGKFTGDIEGLTLIVMPMYAQW